MEIIINRDIRKVKTKDLWIFSWKQAGYMAIALILGAGILLLERKVFHFEKINWYLAIIPMFVPLIFGFFNPFGLSFSDFLKTYINETFVKPQVYSAVYEDPSEIELDYDELIKTYGEEYVVDYGDDLLADFKLDRTSPEFKAELKKADSLGF